QKYSAEQPKSFTTLHQLNGCGPSLRHTIECGVRIARGLVMRQRFNCRPAKTLAGTAVILTVMFASETSLGGQASLERKAPAELEAMRQAFAGAVAAKDRAAVAML